MTPFTNVQYQWHDDFAALKAELPTNRVIVTDANVARCLDLHDQSAIIVAPGEGSKSVETWSHVLGRLADSSATRATTVVAVGGGMVGDLAGFAAATYMRGVPFIQVPTSLLAMVDSSVGGKVAINLPQGKNLVGAFYHPSRVLFCEDALDTLPAREWRSGMAEVLKYGFIGDVDILNRVGIFGRDTYRDVIVRCVDYKRKVVAADERETSDIRATLNFGHTVGHALEAEAGYGDALLHGEAISIGMVVETFLAECLGIARPGLTKEVQRYLEAEELPVDHPYLRQRPDELIARMRRDKKASDGRLTFALVPELGTCRIVREVDEAAVRAALVNVAQG
ncbi:MAG: 3-dehydroquinate synthase [Fimbriimonadaceae bacterium]